MIFYILRAFWTNFNWQGKTWAEFSALDDGICMTRIYHAVPTNMT
jgi:hypothetical protein